MKCGRCGDHTPSRGSICYECELMESDDPISTAVGIITDLFDRVNGLRMSLDERNEMYGEALARIWELQREG